MSNIDEKEIVSALISQVATARPKTGSERDVTTIITRPMWRIWNRATGIREDEEPTEWNALATNRVYGSKTVVVESLEIAAVSFATKQSKP